MSSETLQLRGILIAPAAQRWLGEASGPQVHSTHRNAANLVDRNGELLSLVTQDSGPGPFALVLRPEVPDFARSGGFEVYLSKSSPIVIEGSTLSVGPLRVDWSGAAQWKPRPSWEQVGSARLAESLDHLRELLGRHAPTGSFAPLVEPAAAEAEAGPNVAALAAAAEPARRLVQALRSRDAEKVTAAAERLAGLGAGVTPSGDDYLLGAIHALWALAEPAEAETLSEAIANTARRRTNLISRAWLRAAARGEAGHEWHVLAVALASGAPVDEPAEWLIRRGHTSGADALAGFLAAAQSLLEA